MSSLEFGKGKGGQDIWRTCRLDPVNKNHGVDCAAKEMTFHRLEMCCLGEQTVTLGPMVELRGIVPWRSKEWVPLKKSVSAMAYQLWLLREIKGMSLSFKW